MASIDPGQLSGWFETYGDRLALYARHRRRRHETEHTARWSVWFEPPPDESPDPGQVQAALENLPPDQREIVVLKIGDK